jgi:hypothetical protein
MMPIEGIVTASIVLAALLLLGVPLMAPRRRPLMRTPEGRCPRCGIWLDDWPECLLHNPEGGGDC